MLLVWKCIWVVKLLGERSVKQKKKKKWKWSVEKRIRLLIEWVREEKRTSFDCCFQWKWIGKKRRDLLKDESMKSNMKIKVPKEEEEDKKKKCCWSVSCESISRRRGRKGKEENCCRQYVLCIEEKKRTSCARNVLRRRKI